MMLRNGYDGEGSMSRTWIGMCSVGLDIPVTHQNDDLQSRCRGRRFLLAAGVGVVGLAGVTIGAAAAASHDHKDCVSLKGWANEPINKISPLGRLGGF